MRELQTWILQSAIGTDYGQLEASTESSEQAEAGHTEKHLNLSFVEAKAATVHFSKSRKTLQLAVCLKPFD